ncbi:hypothetical protein G7939_02365 [Ralstonia solanacearum]|uniref:phospholipase D-like domain-containing protein n=1 Tax=Ralstonia pseudosolanacearum TaxID=1310165 RepID=UPI0013F4CD24|nr:hypothetical protein G7939_02365 [Ralstonia solanacearum]QIK30218.1 hypothetical protein G7947_15460 [Ralstonia solanacearum]QIK35122.1 hypothetical protein G7969_15460 [Ralstonia solanacearum]
MLSRAHAQQVRVYNYSIPRAGGVGRDTFHAKVVISDRRYAYVGSANVAAASLDYLMETGQALFKVRVWRRWPKSSTPDVLQRPSWYRTDRDIRKNLSR